MLTFCATGDCLIHIPVPQGHEGCEALSKYIKQADVRITNLETTVTEYDCHASTFSGGTPLTAHPDLLEDLKTLGFQVCTCANNHALDFSFDGVKTTLRHLDKAGLFHAGIGLSLTEAAAPATIRTPKGSAAVFSQSAVYYGNDSGRAGDSRDGIPARPGLNGLRHIDECLVTKEQMAYLRALADETMVNAEEELEKGFGYQPPQDEAVFDFGTVKFRVAEQTGKTSRCHEKDLARAVENIRKAKKDHDYVIATIHSHQFPARVEHEVDHYVAEFAHACIDAGADAVVGTGNHLVKGIELYKEKPIFYCLGNFMFQAEYVERLSYDVVERLGFDQSLTGPEVVAARKARATTAMEKSPLCYLSVLPFWTMDGGKLKEIRLLPISLGVDLPKGLRGIPSPTKPEAVLPHLETVCTPYGTKLKAEGDYIKVILQK